jgi:hypothetical protein
MRPDPVDSIIHIRRVVKTTAGWIGIEVFPSTNHAAVTLYDDDGWQKRGEDSDSALNDIVDSIRSSSSVFRPRRLRPWLERSTSASAPDESVTSVV